MKKFTAKFLGIVAVLVSLVGCMQHPRVAQPDEQARADALPSWNDTDTKKQILAFVESVTDPKSDSFVEIEDRIATFDNDGTLWSERPIYVQMAFAFDRIRELAPKHPEWRTTQPFKAILEGDTRTAFKGGKISLLELVLTSHAGMTTAEFEQAVLEWIETARHPKTKRLYTEMVFQPMLELLAYLRSKGFKTYITSGGGVDFMRAWAKKVYGIPPEQVIGSNVKTEFEMRESGPVLVRRPEIDFVDDRGNKPLGIHRFIGRRPIASFGNSDGDLQMLQWTAAGEGARFMALVHHTDDEREWAYDRKSPIGRLNKAWDEARKRAWTMVDMKRDWKVIYPFELAGRS